VTPCRSNHALDAERIASGTPRRKLCMLFRRMITARARRNSLVSSLCVSRSKSAYPVHTEMGREYLLDLMACRDREAV